MNETISFILFTLIATVVVFALIVWNESARTAEKGARGFYIFCLFLSIAGLINTILSASGMLSVRSYILFNRALTYPGWLVMGSGIGSTILMIPNVSTDFVSRGTSGAVRSFISSRYLLQGLCITVSLLFFAAEIGKFAHDAQMRQFFLESGYPVWFMYFINASETLGAVGLFVSKTRVPAAFGLTMVMFGAIYTHYHNGDPFSDSLDALHLLILILCIISIGLLRRSIRNIDARSGAEK